MYMLVFRSCWSRKADYGWTGWTRTTTGWSRPLRSARYWYTCGHRSSTARSAYPWSIHNCFVERQQRFVKSSTTKSINEGPRIVFIGEGRVPEVCWQEGKLRHVDLITTVSDRIRHTSHVILSWQNNVMNRSSELEVVQLLMTKAG